MVKDRATYGYPGQKDHPLVFAAIAVAACNLNGIVKGVVELARTLGREVIAKGVETQAHGDLLRSIDCTMAQGYGIARPMSAAKVSDWISGWFARHEWQA